MAAAVASPHRSVGRLHEAPFGPAHACLAGAVVAFLAMIGVLLLPSHTESWPSQATSATALVKATSISALFVVECALLVLAWLGRRPRMTAAPSDPVSGLPALATAALGVLVLLMIPGWLALADETSARGSKETLLLGSTAILGLLLLRLGTANMRGALSAVPHGTPATASARRRHSVLATPASAFDVLRDRPVGGYSFTGSRLRPELPTANPVGFSLTRLQDGTLTPPTFGLLLLAAVSTFVALPFLAILVRTLF